MAETKGPIAIRNSEYTLDDVRLPGYFPLKKRACIEPSDEFFHCFSKNSIPNGDQDVARKAVIACKEQLELYKQCMDKFVGPRAEIPNKKRTKWLGFI